MSIPSQSFSNKSIFDENNFNGTSPTLGSISPTNKPNSPDPFSRELSRLQEEQIYYMRKLEKEKQRRDQYTATLAQAKSNLRAIQEKTKNGNIAKDHDIVNKKRIGRLEHQLQTSKIKLSVARNENLTMKKKVQDLRRDKLLHLQILSDLAKEASEARRKNKQSQKEILSLNEKKHKAKVAVVGIKHQMLRDMEEFSRELSAAKASISSTQANIMGTIREKLNATYATAQLGLDRTTDLNVTAGGDGDANASSVLGESSSYYRQSELEALLKDTDFTRLDELLSVLQASEEKMFGLYGETQARHEEMEKIDLENKHLEGQVEEQLTRLRALEGHQDQVKLELERSIEALQTQISKYDGDYQRNLELLASMSENLLSLLKNVAIDHAALDQQLLSTGITDRNIDDYLGLVEQRIDDLIQMSKAAHHQAIRREDFMRTMPAVGDGSSRRSNNNHQQQGGSAASGVLTVPNLPSLQDTVDDDDDTETGGEAAVKLHPVDIGALKELMWRKVQKITVVNSGAKREKLNSGGNNTGAGLNSRQSSKVSIKSSDSSNKLK